MNVELDSSWLRMGGELEGRSRGGRCLASSGPRKVVLVDSSEKFNVQQL